MSTALQMHQARHIGRDEIVGARPTDESDFVVAHLGSHRFLSNREGSAKAAAFVRPFELGKLDPRDVLQQIFWLGELRVVYEFAHRSHAEAADRGTTSVQSYFVLELRPRELSDLKNVVQKFHEIVHTGRDLATLR